MTHYEGDLRRPEGARLAILASRWNPRIVDTLVAGARRALADVGLGRLRVLGTPRKQIGLAGFGLEVVEYVEVPGHE